MIVTGVRLNDLGASIRAGGFEITSGFSTAQGGGDEGPGPHEILQAALTACTIITVQMYAKRKGWALQSTHVTVEITSEDKSGTVIARKIQFDGDLDDEQRARLLEIADKCPIHRLLEGPIKINTSVEKV